MTATVVRLLAVSGSQALVLFLVARTLSTELTGQFTIVLVIAQSVTLLANLGLGNSSIYMIRSGQVEREVAAAILSAWWLFASLLLCFLSVALPASLLSQAEVFLGTSNLRFAFWLPIGILSSQVLLSFFHAERRFFLFNGLWAVGPLIWLAVVAVGCTSELVTVADLLSWTLGAWLTGCAITTTVFVTQARPAFMRLWRAGAQAFTMAKLGMLGSLNGVLVQLNNRADLLVVAVCLGDASAAVYAVAAFGAEAVNLASSGITTVAYPNAVQRFAEGDISHELTGRLFRMTGYAASVTALGVFVVLGGLVTLALRADYAAALLPLGVLFLGTIPYSACRILAVEISSLGRFDLNCWAAGFALTTNVVLTLFLAPRLGLLGAALGSTAAYWLHVAVIIGLHRKLRQSPWRLFLPRVCSDVRFLFAGAGADQVTQEETA